MNTLELYSERYSPSGNVTSEGVLNQLGRPKLDLLAVLMREAVQNSWDARLPTPTSIRFGVAGWTISEEQRQLLKKVIFPYCPPDISLNDLLNSSRELQVLAIYDRGTEGLGGPTRADQLPAENEPNNFVDFLRNVGQPPDKYLAGGTYGYGKAVFYRASEVHTILVHTRCLSNGKLQSRFMGAALGSPFVDKQHRFTGRHWWGRTEDEVSEPILNQDSEWLATQLGLPGFQGSERGTTIVIIQPVWGDKTPEQASQLMAEYLLWYFWPKMLANDNGVPPIQFEMSWQGETILIPHPTDFPPLEGFVQAMKRLKLPPSQQAAGSGETCEIRTNQYKQYLGKLALERFPVRERPIRSGDETAPISGTSHHVALMRQPELVVRYLDGPELPSSQIEYAGVFITDAPVDKVFADSEPPTHDDWISNYVHQHREKVLINSAFREIKKKMDEFVRPPATQTAPGGLTPLGAFANQLGALLPGQTGNAAFSNLFARRRSIKSGAASQFDTKSTSPSPHQERPSIMSDDTRPVGGTSNNFDGRSASDGSYTGTGGTPSQNSRGDFEHTGTSSSQNPPDMTAPATSKKPSKVRIIRIEEGELIELNDGSPILRVEFELQFSGDPCTAIVRGTVGALLDGDEIESEPPEGSAVPQILYWENIHGQRYEETSEISIASNQGGIWYTIVTVPEDVMVGIELSASVQVEANEQS